MKMIFYTNCVNWSREDVHAEGGLCDMISSGQDITRRTFLRHVDRASRGEVEQALGYAPHDPGAVLTMKRDFHVSYHKGKLHGETVYFFKHSAIEYVFRRAS